jgi:hypothetical protein
MTVEDAFYQDQAIRITSTRVIVSTKTHLVAELESASVLTVAGSAVVPGVFFAIGWVMCCPMGLFLGLGGAAVDNVNDALPQLVGVLLLSLAGLGLLCLVVGAAVLFLQKPRYSITVKRASGFYNILYSPKKDYAQTVAGVINEAIARGAANH